MNTTLLSIRTDAKTKRDIADFAASLGLSTSALVTAVLKQALREKRLVLEPDLNPSPRLQKQIKQAVADYKAGRNISGPFDNADDMLAALDA